MADCDSLGATVKRALSEGLMSYFSLLHVRRRPDLAECYKKTQPNSMGQTRVRLPFRGVASTNPDEVKQPRAVRAVFWLIVGIAGFALLLNYFMASCQ